MQKEAAQSTQRWYAVWSLVLWVGGVASLALTLTWGFISLLGLLLNPAGAALAILALRMKGETHRGLAVTGLVLNALTIVLYVVLLAAAAALAAA